MKWLTWLTYLCLILFEYYILTFEIHLEDIKLEQNYENIPISSECKEIHIPNRYTQIILKTNLTNVGKLLITDIKLEDINSFSNTNTYCSLYNSSICSEVINPSFYDFKVDYCIESLFIYACPSKQQLSWIDSTLSWLNKDKKVNSFISISTKVNSSPGCNSLEFSPYSQCGSLGLSNCRSNNNCLKKCAYYECNTNDKTVFSMCLPELTTYEEVLERCKAHVDFINFTPIINKQICNYTITQSENLIDYQQSHGFFKIVCVFMGITILATFMISVYFRYKVSNDNVQPFNVPNFCPNFIFPRIN